MNLKLERLICVLLIFLISLVPAAYSSHSNTLKTFTVNESQNTEYPWPMFLHDLEHTGYTESPAPRMPTILWNYTMGDTSWGPVVAYGKVFLGSVDKKVYALDQMTGAKVWEFITGNSIRASPVVANDKVFIGSTDGKVYALDQSSGAKVWESNIGAEIGSSPAIAEGKLYIGAVDGKVYALDGGTGAKVWEYATGGAIIFSSPAIIGNLLFIGSCDGYLYALDKNDGTKKWKAEISDGKWYFISSPAVSDHKVFIGSPAYNKTYAFDIYTGAKIWEFNIGGRIESSPAIADGKVFISSINGKVYALDQSSGAKVWESNIGKEAMFPLAIADEMIITSSYNGKIYVLHKSNGSKFWNMTLGGTEDVGTYLAVADGKIYVVFGNTLYAVGNIPPEISEPWQDPMPDNVQPLQNVTVWVNVTDYGTGIKNVTLWYSINNGTTWTPKNMTQISTNTFQATIPGYEYSALVTYKIIAYDNAGNNATKDNFGYYYKYHVIPEYPLTLILVFIMATTLITTSILKIKKRRQFL